jgi:pimeloyl-ACP methyl ester carboxylesterase
LTDYSGAASSALFAWLKGNANQNNLYRQGLRRSLTVALLLLAPVVAASHDEILSVGGQNLHIETLGESGPTIVFEAGLGNDSSTWKFVAGPIAKFAPVVLYDRAGLGQSLPMISENTPVMADQVAANLRKLLSTADIHPPYMLVGHSLGGLYVQMFARKYPSDVSGVVLLDSASTEAPSELKTRALAGLGGLS